MSEQTSPTQQEIEAKIAMMNQAEHAYDNAPGRDEKNKADHIFGEGWDWLHLHHIAFYRDPENKIYRLGQKPS